MTMPTTFAGLVNTAKEMNTDIFTAFSVLSSNEMTGRFRKLMKETKSVDFFEHGGRIYKGSRRVATIAFMLNNPTKADFSVWLDDNYKIYCPVS